MIKSRNGKVSIKGTGEDMVKDLCAASIGVRDTIAEANNNDSKKASKFLLSIIAYALGVKVEFKNAGDTDA